MKHRRRLAWLLLTLTAFLLAGVAVPMASASAIPGDCKGDAPMPQSPYGHAAIKPAAQAQGDPFTDPSVSLESTWGTEYRMTTYDNGCNPANEIMPDVATNLANFMGLEIPGLIPNWGHFLMDQVVDPSAWIGPLDKPMQEASQATHDGVWAPWAGMSLIVVACLVLWRSRAGQLARSITAVVWAAAVLLLCTWFMSYPTEAAGLLDEGVQSATVSIATGFSHGGSGGQGRPAALAAMDRNYDAIVRNTQFRTWAEGEFGNADSPTAKKYAPDLFKATHFSWAEYDQYQADPKGKGKQILDAKAETFKKTAQAVQDSDPVAYNYLTGNEWSSRLTAGFLNLLMVAGICLFLLAAAVAVFLAYVVVRLFIPVAPAAGVLFMLDTFRGTAMAVMRRVAHPIVMGPVYLMGGLVLAAYDAAVLNSQLNFMVKVIFVIATTWIAWKLLRPQWVIPGAGLRRSGLDMVKTFAAARFGAKAGLDAAEDEHEQEQEKARPRRVSQQPVALPAIEAAPMFARPLTIGPGAGTQPVDADMVSTPQDRAASTVMTPGTFVDRDAVSLPGPALEAPQRARSMRALPPVADDAGATALPPGDGPLPALPVGEVPTRESEADTSSSVWVRDDVERSDAHERHVVSSGAGGTLYVLGPGPSGRSDVPGPTEGGEPPASAEGRENPGAARELRAFTTLGASGQPALGNVGPGRSDLVAEASDEGGTFAPRDGGRAARGGGDAGRPAGTASQHQSAGVGAAVLSPEPDRGGRGATQEIVARPVDGRLVQADELSDVAEANETLDEKGRPVFVIYSPAGSTTYYRGDS